MSYEYNQAEYLLLGLKCTRESE